MIKKPNPNETQDKHLIAMTLEGNSQPFGEIVERYWNMAVALAISKINDRTAAEDIAQQSFIKAYSNLGKLRNPEYFAGWLAKIVLQQCVDHLRKNAEAKNLTSLETLNSELVHSSTSFTDAEAASIRNAINQLPDKLKEVVILRFVTSLNSAQIAQQLGIRHGTVRVWLHRAYQILKKQLTGLFKEGQ